MIKKTTSYITICMEVIFRLLFVKKVDDVIVEKKVSKEQTLFSGKKIGVTILNLKIWS